MSKKFLNSLSALICVACVLLLASCNHDPIVPVPPPTPGTLVSTAVSAVSPAAGAVGAGTNTKIAVRFANAMAASTISAANFTLSTAAGVAVTGTVTYDAINNIATFAPAASLLPNTGYTATLTTGVTDQGGNAFAAKYTWAFSTGNTTDTTAPQVSATVPANLATGVAVNARVAVVFTKELDASTVTISNVTLTAGSTPVPGSVRYAGGSVIFTPAANLAPNVVHTATVTSSLKDLAGNNLPNSVYRWSFTTGAAANTSLPAVSNVSPANQATGVPLNQSVAAVFGTPMDASSISTASFQLTQVGGVIVPGTVSAAGNAAVFAPAANLAASTNYIATLTTSVKDLAGNALPASFVWSFTTGTSLSATQPAVTLTVPANGATGVVLNQGISLTFNGALNPLSINAATIVLTTAAGVAVAGTPSYYPASNIVSFVPAANLLPNTSYILSLGSGLADLNGNALGGGQTVNFVTGTSTGNTAPVNLRSLATFAVVAGNGLVSSNTSGQTTINGNLALAPNSTCTGDGAACSALSPLVNGSTYINDASGVAVAARADVAAAAAEAAIRGGATFVSDLSGMTLKPGVYGSGNTLTVAAGGTLTLDAAGDANAVWVLQSGGTLTLNSGAQIVLANGARAGNVFWSVGGAASIGSNVNFSGNLLAGSTITLGSSSTVNGRLLSASGQVTLVSDTVTRPGP